jgi:hypothetical protein
MDNRFSLKRVFIALLLFLALLLILGIIFVYSQGASIRFSWNTEEACLADQNCGGWVATCQEYGIWITKYNIIVDVYDKYCINI